MSGMVEKVTRAIGESLYCFCDPVDTPNTWARAEAVAIVAFQAMRDEARHPMFTAMIDRAIQEHSSTVNQGIDK